MGFNRAPAQAANGPELQQGCYSYLFFFFLMYFITGFLCVWGLQSQMIKKEGRGGTHTVEIIYIRDTLYVRGCEYR